MIQEVLVSPLGWAVITCPRCGLKSHVKPEKELLHTVLQRTCSCGAKHQVIFDTRSEPRKKCSLPAIILADTQMAVVIDNISEIGAYLEEDDLDLKVGGTYRMKIKLNERWIEVTAKIIRTNTKMAGVKFINLGFRERKAIEYFLLSDNDV